MAKPGRTMNLRADRWDLCAIATGDIVSGAGIIRCRLCFGSSVTPLRRGVCFVLVKELTPMREA